MNLIERYDDVMDKLMYYRHLKLQPGYEMTPHDWQELKKYQVEKIELEEKIMGGKVV